MKVEVKGIEKATKSLGRYAKAKESQVRLQTRTSAVNVDRETKKRLSKQVGYSLGRLISSYHTRHSTTPIYSDVYSNLFYAPFVEFGTGKGVFQSSEYDFTAQEREYAKQFQRGPGRDAPANPTLFPSWAEEKPKYIEAIKQALRKL